MNDMREVSKHYTGIGSRATPQAILQTMTNTARLLDELEFTLRSGAARGADTAFETGASRAQVFLPWPYFNNHRSTLYSGNPELPWAQAQAIAARTHPAWGRCTDGARKLHTRNIFQVLGPTLDEPSDFVICWTPHGKEVGGTAQAIRLAKQYNIPVYNLGAPDGDTTLRAFLSTF